jgi:hypothetical protein
VQHEGVHILAQRGDDVGPAWSSGPNIDEHRSWKKKAEAGDAGRRYIGNSISDDAAYVLEGLLP